jgi:hypothetical protein
VKKAIHDLIGVAQLLGQQVVEIASQPHSLVARQPPPQPSQGGDGQANEKRQ